MRSGLAAPTLVAAVTAVVVLTPAFRPGASSPPAGPRLEDLRGLDDLRERFNRAAGVPRLVLLLSPT